MEERSADIVDFPLNGRHCGDCVNAFLGVFGVWCDELQIPIWDEAREARKCGAYQKQ